MTTLTANAPNSSDLTRTPAAVRAGDPIRLTLTELDAAAGGGGGAGINPSRDGVRLTGRG